MIFAFLIAVAIQPDPEMGFSVYTIRGGPRPAAVPSHYWTRNELPPELCWDGRANWTWQLYRKAGAPPMRRTDECPEGTWGGERRKRIGLTNYELYEEPQLAGVTR